jgi:hypothetical protein
VDNKTSYKREVISFLFQWVSVFIGLLCLSCGSSDYAGIESQNGYTNERELNSHGRVGNKEGDKLAFGRSDTCNDSFRALANELARNCRVKDQSAIKVAVMDFLTPSGARCSLSAPVAEVLSNSLFYSNFRIVERRMLEQIVKELNFVQEDVFDPQKVAQLGKQVGADAIVIGSIEASYERYSIRARMIESESGIWISAASIDLDREVAEQRGRCRTLGVTTKPSSRVSNSVKAASEAIRETTSEFFLEDFRDVANGEAPAGWVASDRLMVQGEDRDRGLYITSRKGEASAVIGGVHFPSAFRLEFILLAAFGKLSFTSGDLNISISVKYDTFYVSMCKEERRFGSNSIASGMRHAVVLEKKRHVVRLLIDGTEAIVIRKSDFTTGDVIQLAMSDEMAIYRIKGTSL